MCKAWEGFTAGAWQSRIDVRDFIQKNYTPYGGDEAFLAPATPRTQALMHKLQGLMKLEQEFGGVLDVDTQTVSSLLNYKPGYLDKDNELIVGLQTDRPLKRGVNPFGGIRMAREACRAYGYELSGQVEQEFAYRTTHNDGVFRVYNEQTRAARHCGLITGLPDAYGRGRIIGDYRRVALYGTDRLIEEKKKDKAELGRGAMTDENIRLIEEVWRQIDFLGKLRDMAALYGCDISRPAQSAREAVQWTYFGYLGAIKEQNGAAMSLGRTSTFLDVYAQRDLAAGVYTERQIQEFVDHFIMKLRLIKFARTPEYNDLFSGDPQWVTESIGGVGIDGRHMVTKMSYRYLHTLQNLGTAPEPNLTVLWSTRLPESFKRFCAKTSIESSSVQYENDDLMRVTHGDDYAIACCVSSMRVGKEMQFFGARANLAKCLLYAINGGVDEITKKQVGPRYRPVTGDYLDYDDVMEKYRDMMKWLAQVYVNTLNIIHYMHDKYCYEKLQMALHDKKVTRWFATGIAGLSVVADSLSAIKYARVKCIRDADGIVVDYEVEGDFPKYGNDDDRVDGIASELVDTFMSYVKGNHTYRGGIPTTSILTITSNVVYGKNTGSTPDGRKKGEPFAPGANPMHGSSRATWRWKCPSLRRSIERKAAAMTEQEKQRQIDALVERIDAFMKNGGGRMRVTGGEGEAQETRCAACCGEGAAEACNAPAKRAGHKSR